MDLVGESVDTSRYVHNHLRSTASDLVVRAVSSKTSCPFLSTN